MTSTDERVELIGREVARGTEPVERNVPDELLPPGMSKALDRLAMNSALLEHRHDLA